MTIQASTGSTMIPQADTAVKKTTGVLQSYADGVCIDNNDCSNGNTCWLHKCTYFLEVLPLELVPWKPAKADAFPDEQTIQCAGELTLKENNMHYRMDDRDKQEWHLGQPMSDSYQHSDAVTRRLPLPYRPPPRSEWSRGPDYSCDGNIEQEKFYRRSQFHDSLPQYSAPESSQRFHDSMPRHPPTESDPRFRDSQPRYPPKESDPRFRDSQPRYPPKESDPWFHNSLPRCPPKESDPRFRDSQPRYPSKESDTRFHGSQPRYPSKESGPWFHDSQPRYPPTESDPRFHDSQPRYPPKESDPRFHDSQPRYPPKESDPRFHDSQPRYPPTESDPRFHDTHSRYPKESDRRFHDSLARFPPTESSSRFLANDPDRSRIHTLLSRNNNPEMEDRRSLQGELPRHTSSSPRIYNDDIPSLLDGPPRLGDYQRMPQSDYGWQSTMSDYHESPNFDINREQYPRHSSRTSQQSHNPERINRHDFKREPAEIVDRSLLPSRPKMPRQNYSSEQKKSNSSVVVDGVIIKKTGEKKWNCTVCQLNFSSWKDVSMHSQNALHIANQHHEEKKSTARADEKGRKREGLSDKDGGYHKKQRLTCAHCNVLCGSEVDFQDHLKGKRHAASIEAIAFLEKSKKQNQASSMNKQDVSMETSQTYCALCSLECHEKEAFEVHLNGIRHHLKIKALEKNTKTPTTESEKNTFDPERDSYLAMAHECGIARTDKVSSVDELKAYKRRVSLVDRLTKVIEITDSPDYDLCLICAKKVTPKNNHNEHLAKWQHTDEVENITLIKKWMDLLKLMINPDTCEKAFKDLDAVENGLKGANHIPCTLCGVKNPRTKQTAKNRSKKHIETIKHISCVRIAMAVTGIGRAAQQQNGWKISLFIKKYERLLFETENNSLTQKCKICDLDNGWIPYGLFVTVPAFHYTTLHHNLIRYYLEELVLQLQPLKEVDFVKQLKLPVLKEVNTVAVVNEESSDEEKVHPKIKNPVGPQFIETHYLCIICDQLMTDKTTAFGEHCQTKDHVKAVELQIASKKADPTDSKTSNNSAVAMETGDEILEDKSDVNTTQKDDKTAVENIDEDKRQIIDTGEKKSDKNCDTDACVEKLDKTSVTETGVEKLDKTSVTETGVEKLDKTSITETGVEKLDKTDVTETGVEKSDKTSVTETGVEKSDKTSVTETGVEKLDKTSVTETGVEKSDKTGVEKSNKTDVTVTGVGKSEKTDVTDTGVEESDNTGVGKSDKTGDTSLSAAKDNINEENKSDTIKEHPIKNGTIDVAQDKETEKCAEKGDKNNTINVDKKDKNGTIEVDQADKTDVIEADVKGPKVCTTDISNKGNKTPTTDVVDKEVTKNGSVNDGDTEDKTNVSDTEKKNGSTADVKDNDDKPGTTDAGENEDNSSTTDVGDNDKTCTNDAGEDDNIGLHGDENEEKAGSSDDEFDYLTGDENDETDKGLMETASGEEFIQPCFLCILCDEYVMDSTTGFGEHCQTKGHARAIEAAKKRERFPEYKKRKPLEKHAIEARDVSSYGGYIIRGKGRRYHHHAE
ncbi:uncharacterized protein LOC100369775 [Saccoglossus kowalevskii]|uniref:Uncharacterized protein LOC100369775 n=1 Tax=Saccoglossus kowalevskii TaxID=10224 RepID=A0ABM0MES5_SACKO|nr:PREDICTED: uncharacterized protein LOC100369775 [Saccoglossus kowalevskii]